MRRDLRPNLRTRKRGNMNRCTQITATIHWHLAQIAGQGRTEAIWAVDERSRTVNIEPLIECPTTEGFYDTALNEANDA